MPAFSNRGNAASRIANEFQMPKSVTDEVADSRVWQKIARWHPLH